MRKKEEMQKGQRVRKRQRIVGVDKEEDNIRNQVSTLNFQLQSMSFPKCIK